tara:strand:- start:1056 stop:1421 length:366 start_codon:yes stop_codon:yes gene_type:complete
MAYINKQPLMEGNVKKYLDKVADRIASETEITTRSSGSEKVVFITTPFYYAVSTEDKIIEMKELLEDYAYSMIDFLELEDMGKLSHYFELHVKNIYGLSKEELPYTHKKYIDTILLKINGR